VFDGNADGQFSYWDTAGHDDYDSLRPFSYPLTDVFLVCYSVFWASSQAHVVTKWLPEITHHCPDAAIIIVGTKGDMLESWKSVQGKMDPTWLASAKWDETCEKMQRRQRLWNMRHVSPLFKKSKDPSKPVKSGECLLTRLPDEILLLLFSYLHTPDLGKLAQTCKEMRYITNDFSVWKSRDKKEIKEGVKFHKNNTQIPWEYRKKIYSYDMCSALTGEGVGHVLERAREAVEARRAAVRKEEKKKGFRGRITAVLRR